MRERRLRQSQPAPKALEACIVVSRNGGKRRNGWALPSVAAVMLPHEGLTSGSRRQPDGATERRPRGERHLQPTGACRRPQRALVHAELTRELIERQEFGVPRMLRCGHRGSLEQVRRCRPQSAVPHPKRVQRHVEQRGKFLLREIGGTTQFAQRSHGVHTMPLVPRIVKRPPAYQAGDHECVSCLMPSCRIRRIAKHAGNGDREIREFWRELARLITLFDECSPANFLADEIGEFFRKWRARQDSNLRPPA